MVTFAIGLILGLVLGLWCFYQVWIKDQGTGSQGAALQQMVLQQRQMLSALQPREGDPNDPKHSV